MLLASIITALQRRHMRCALTYLQVALRVNQQIFRLEVSIDEIKRVKVLEGEDDLRCVEARMRLTATAFLFTTSNCSCRCSSLIALSYQKPVQ